MICTRCLQRRATTNALLAIPPRPHPHPHPSPFFLAQRSLQSSRNLSTVSSPLRQATTTTAAATTTTTTTETPPPPPFSTPFTASSSESSSTDAAADTSSPHNSPKPRSKTAAGVTLRGLGYLKNQEQPKAWADDEYPEWLWGLLDSKKEDGGGEGSGSGSGGGVGGKGFGDAYSKSKKQRRIAAKAAAKAELERSSEPDIPLQHQSIDLAFGEGTGEEEAAGRKARDELKKTMRQARRKAIKERNFLSGI